jgi:hypothetical protein
MPLSNRFSGLSRMMHHQFFRDKRAYIQDFVQMLSIIPAFTVFPGIIAVMHQMFPTPEHFCCFPDMDAGRTQKGRIFVPMNQNPCSPLQRLGEACTSHAKRPVCPFLAGRAAVGMLAIWSLCVVISSLLFSSPVFAQAHQATATSPTSSASPKTAAAPATTREVFNWAGNVATGSRGTYRQAKVEFRVPTISNIQPGHWVSIWAGVGGVVAGGRVLVQAGVTVKPGSNGKQVNTAWWEVVPGFSQQSLHFAHLHAGDTIIVIVSSNLGNDGKDRFFVEDTSQHTGNVDESGSMVLSGPFSDSATGECIVERPTLGGTLGEGGTLTELANFGTEQMVGCDVGGESTLKSVGAWPHTDYIMINKMKKATTLALPGPLSAGTFTVKWLASH